MDGAKQKRTEMAKIAIIIEDLPNGDLHFQSGHEIADDSRMTPALALGLTLVRQGQKILNQEISQSKELVEAIDQVVDELMERSQQKSEGKT